MDDLLYCYPGTNVLKNKLSIQDQKKLRDVERKLTALRIADLIRKPIRGSFDLKHLCAIHFYVFQDLFAWAGELRKVNISKGNMFCRVEYLSSQAGTVFGAIGHENYLQGLEYDMFVKRLAYHFSEINALHPFREGNGRTQREFIRELALYNGYAIDFSKAAPDEMFNASVDSFLCRYEKMEVLFDQCLRKLK